MSRIQVQFPWQKRNESTTPWIRVTTPYAGNGKGFHVVPEIGEEVLVEFEGGNPEKPIVIGAMFHGQGKSGHGGAGNFMKGFQTPSGNKLQLNDQDGSVFLADKGGANMKFDGAGNSTTNADSNHTVNAGSSNLINVGGKEGEAPSSMLKMDADGNVVIDAKSSIKLKVGENILSIDKEGLIKINGKNIKQTAENKYDMQAKKVFQKADGANFKIDSDQNVVISGGNEVKLK